MVTGKDVVGILVVDEGDWSEIVIKFGFIKSNCEVSFEIDLRLLKMFSCVKISVFELSIIDLLVTKIKNETILSTI